MIDDILASLEREPAEPPAYPTSYYSADGDCVFVYNQGGEYVRQRVDNLLTVFRAPMSGRIIGLQIKGIRHLPPHEGIHVHVAGRVDGAGRRVQTVRLLLLSFAQPADPEPERTKAYTEAMEFLGAQSLEVDLAGSR